MFTYYLEQIDPQPAMGDRLSPIAAYRPMAMRSLSPMCHSNQCYKNLAVA